MYVDIEVSPIPVRHQSKAAKAQNCTKRDEDGKGLNFYFREKRGLWPQENPFFLPTNGQKLSKLTIGE